MKKIRIIFLTIKYWLQGDELKDAFEFAKAIVKGFK